MLKFKQMYTREILLPRISPIEDGDPVIGTWNRAFERVDLLEIRRPYRFPLPRWARNYRIKEWECFCVNNDSFYMEAVFCNVKLFRIAHVILYEKGNEQKFFFRKVIPGTGWPLPVSLYNGSVDSHSARFYFCIHSWLDADTIKLDINIEAARHHPALTAHLAYNVKTQDVTPMAASLGFAERRIMYAYKTLAPVQGDMVLNGRRINLKQEKCSGFFYDCRGFFPYSAHMTICGAMGFDEKNRRYGFHIAENQTRETNKNNENALWVNGQLTPLPPVLVTMPNGLYADWVIQDIEGMVDLTFTPKEQIKSGIKLLFANADLNAQLGYYNGMLVNSEGEQINIKNLFGTGEKLYLRV